MGTLTELKKYLRNKSTRELVDEIAYLYKTFPIVKDYYQGTFFMSDKDVALKYKKASKKQIDEKRSKAIQKVRKDQLDI